MTADRTTRRWPGDVFAPGVPGTTAPLGAVFAGNALRGTQVAWDRTVYTAIGGRLAIWGTVVLPHWSGQSTVKVTVPVRLWSERGETRVSLSPPTCPGLSFAITGTGTATLSLEWVADATIEGGGYWRLLRAFYRFEK